MTETLANLKLDVKAVGTSGTSLTLDSDVHTVCLQARGADVQLKLGAVGDSEYWTLSDGVPQSFSDGNLAGRTLYFDVASGSHNVEVIQMKKAVA